MCTSRLLYFSQKVGLLIVIVWQLQEDKKWVCQYDSAFLVMNKIGQVISWKFTKGSSFDEVKEYLEFLSVRAHSQGDTVYIDNCCHRRSKIQSVFGENCIVKLDTFHAVQRIVHKIPQRHPFHAASGRCFVEGG